MSPIAIAWTVSLAFAAVVWWMYAGDVWRAYHHRAVAAMMATVGAYFLALAVGIPLGRAWVPWLLRAGWVAFGLMGVSMFVGLVEMRTARQERTKAIAVMREVNGHD